MDLQLAKKRLFDEFMRREARMVADLIRNSPEETDTTTTGDNRSLMSSGAHPAEDEWIDEAIEDQKQIEEPVITDWEDLSTSEVVVAETTHSATSIDAEVFREDETKQESAITSFVQLELPQALKVRSVVV